MTGRGGLQGINQVNKDTEGNIDELLECLYELKLAATKNSETIQQVDSKTLNMVEELIARINTLTKKVAAQQKNHHLTTKHHYMTNGKQ
jgi:hypothetical protein